MTSFLYLALIPAMILAFMWWQDHYARRSEPEPDLSWIEAVKAQPEPTWDQPTDVTRTRLYVVPEPPARLIPMQRRPYDVERDGL